MLPSTARLRRERRRSALPVLLALLLALSICYMIIFIHRVRRHSVAADSHAQAVSIAADASAELSRQIEGFEKQHAEWAQHAAARTAAAGSGYRSMRAKRRGSRRASATAADSGTNVTSAIDVSSDSVLPGSEGCSSDPGKGCMPSPAVIIMSHDRADMLKRSLGQLCDMRMHREFVFYVSEDSGRPELNDVAKSAGCMTEMLHFTQPAGARFKGGFAGSGYAKILRHFQFALGAVLGAPPSGRGHTHAVVFEDDLLLSPDTLLYFWSTAWLLEHDPSLWCVSAWNDQGYPHVAIDPSALGRTDYFPGLGWMITGKLWREELAPKWPRTATTGWDHWMRLSSTSQGRECIRPEVPRTRHASTRGTNVKDNRPFEAFAFERIGMHTFGDLHGLLRPMFDASMAKLFAWPTVVHEWPGPVRLSRGGSATTWLSGLSEGETLTLTYTRERYREMATALGLWKESPRGTHNGTIVLHTPAGATVILADRRKCPWLGAEHTMLPMPGFVEIAAQPGVSCATTCASKVDSQGTTMKCDPAQLEFSHNCEALARFFACEAGCGHQVSVPTDAAPQDL